MYIKILIRIFIFPFIPYFLILEDNLEIKIVIEEYKILLR